MSSTAAVDVRVGVGSEVPVGGRVAVGAAVKVSLIICIANAETVSSILGVGVGSGKFEEHPDISREMIKANKISLLDIIVNKVPLFSGTQVLN